MFRLFKYLIVFLQDFPLVDLFSMRDCTRTETQRLFTEKIMVIYSEGWVQEMVKSVILQRQNMLVNIRRILLSKVFQ